MPRNHQRKSKKNTRAKHNRSKRYSRVQKGGVSPYCEVSPSASLLVSNPGVDIHNTNPQASLDLDNKFMQYGGPVPLGSNIMGGGGSCGDEGVGTGKVKSETFKQYMDSLSKTLDIQMGGQPGNNNNESEPTPMNTNSPAPDPAPMNTNSPAPMNPDEMTTGPAPGNMTINTSSVNDADNYSAVGGKKRNSRKTRKTRKHTGGGFSTDPSEFVAGMPVYKAYDDCCPPAIVNGQLQFGAPDQPVCGLGAVKSGGGKKKQLNRKGKNMKKHSKKGRVQRGGYNLDNLAVSRPASYDDAFKGAPGVFEYPDDMTKRDFGCHQPSWGPTCI